MSHPVHLLVADDALVEGHRTGTYVAACGEPVSAPSAEVGVSCDPRYCPACVRAAIRWTAPDLAGCLL